MPPPIPTIPILEGESYNQYCIRNGLNPLLSASQDIFSNALYGGSVAPGFQFSHAPVPENPDAVDDIGINESGEFVNRTYSNGSQIYPGALPNGFTLSTTHVEEDEVIDPSPKKFTEMDEKRVKSIALARNKFYEWYSNRKNEMPEQGRRESQYSELIERDKRRATTLTEIIQGEMPVPLEDIGDKLILQLLDANHPDIRNHKFVDSATGVRLSTSYGAFLGGRIYAYDTLPQMHLCSYCKQLRKDCKKTTLFDESEVMVCPSCLKERNTCRHCDSRINAKYSELRVCASCLQTASATTSTSRRGYSINLKWVDKEHGSIMQSSRMFSCEVEGLTSNGNWLSILDKTLPSEAGIATDGSVEEANMAGFEVQTPRLAGKKGEEFVKRITSSISSMGASINHTCGMHIHLDAKGILLPDRLAYPVSLLQLFKAYLVFEDVILSFLPHSRRRNDYCRPLSEVFRLVEIERVDSIIELEKIWYRERTMGDISAAKDHHYHASRYFGTNFNSLFAHRNLEIRFHSGTINPQKILEWANLHALIMDAAEKQLFDVEFLRDAMASSRLSEKTHMLFEKIGLAPSSRQYFRARQRKFGDRKNEDDENIVVKLSSGIKPPARSRVYMPNIINLRPGESTQEAIQRINAEVRGGIRTGGTFSFTEPMELVEMEDDISEPEI